MIRPLGPKYAIRDRFAIVAAFGIRVERLRNNGTSEPVSFADNSFQDTWFFGIIPQRRAELMDSSVDPMASIDENIIAPQALDDLFSRDQAALVLSEKNKKLHGVLLELEHTISTTQLISRYVEVEFIELENFGTQ